MNQIPFGSAEQPRVQVLADGCWRGGSLVMWTWGPMGWFGIVEWQPVDDERRVNIFPHDLIRHVDDRGRLSAEQLARTPWADHQHTT